MDLSQIFAFFLFPSIVAAVAALIQWIVKHEAPWDTVNRWILLYKLKNILKNRPKLIPKIDPFATIASLVLPTKEEAKLETKPEAFSGIAFHGVDVDSGSSLVIGLNLLEGLKTKVHLRWNDEESKECFTLAMDSPVNREQSPVDQFSAAGIHLAVLEPMRRWRILFNGMLRKLSNDEVVHVKMNLIWSAVHNPFDWTSDIAMNPVAKELKVSENQSLEKICQLMTPNGYDQWGSIFGDVQFFEPISEKKIYMRGLRQHHFGLEEGAQKEFQLMGVTENGFHFVIHQKILHDDLYDERTIINSGHLLIPGRDIFPIDDFDIENFEWHQELLAKKHFAVQQNFIRIQAGGRSFNIGVQLKPDDQLVSNSERIGFESCQMSSDLTFNCRRGRAICFSRTRKQAKENLTTDTSEILVETDLYSSSKKNFVVPLDSTVCTCSALTGGKAASLALMLGTKSSLGENVEIPLGICVTTSGYERQLEKFPELAALVNEVESQSFRVNAANENQTRNEEKKKLEDICFKTSNAFVCRDVDTVVFESMVEQLNHVFGCGAWQTKKFAVRSSAVGEDSSDLSSAGQNETFLGCSGEESLKISLRKCWASVYAFQSVEYRRQNGQPVKTGMAVVIQEMVPAEAAGVLFTRNPTTGNPSEIIITANFGLGESVVSAKSDPDTITIRNKFWEHSLLIESTKIGAKSTRIDMSGDSGVIEEQLDVSVSSQSCLQEETILRLAELGIRVEEKFTTPRDIEFAIVKDTIYLLQSRPITSLLSWSDEDLLHEFDTATFSDEDIWTKANLGEVIPGASTALTNSLMISCLDVSIQRLMLAVPSNQQSFSPYTRRIIPVSYNHCFFNYLDCCLPQIEGEEINSSIKAVDMAVFGHEVTTKKAIGFAIDRRGFSSKFDQLLRLSSVAASTLRAIYWQKMGIDEKLQVHLFEGKDFEQVTPNELYHLIGQRGDILEKLCMTHSRISEASTIFQLMIFLTLAENAPVSSWSTDLYADAANLFASDAGDVLSAGCPTELNKLSETISKADTNESLFSSLSTDEAEAWLMKTPKVSEEYEKFIEKFGHRCLREFEMSSKPWCEDRGPLIKTLQAIVASKCNQSSAQHNRKTGDEKLDSLQNPIKANTRRALKFLLPFTHGAVALRETSKSLLVSKTHEMRVAYRTLASKLCGSGYLPEPDLIYHMTHFEIGELIEKRSPAIIQKAIRRRRLRPTWDELRFREMLQGPPKPIETDFSAETGSDDSPVVYGTPVCRGKYRGKARVITRLEDASSIQQGDVLITISTDIGWSPYFPLLGAVATELGGLISHGAVVAREYGLPCVVGAEGATSVFKTGDIVLMDASKGKITKELPQIIELD